MKQRAKIRFLTLDNFGILSFKFGNLESFIQMTKSKVFDRKQENKIR